MRTPTTSGSLAQDPGVRVCPGCEAVNGPTVAFCWQCYRPFQAAEAGIHPVPPPPRAAGLRGALREPEPVLAPAPTRSRPSLGAVVSTVLVAAAVATGVVVFVSRGSSPELPGSFGGVSQMRGGEVDLVLEQFHSEADRQGIDADMALYGSAGVPSAALVWVQDLTVPTTEEAFDAFATGFNQGLGIGSLDDSRTVTALVGGTSYLCAPVAAAPPVNICMWDEDEVFWVLLDLSGDTRLSATQDLAVAARNAAD